MYNKAYDIPSKEKRLQMENHPLAMPLLSTPYKLGGCLKAIEKIENPDLKNIALAEYYYFTGKAEKASKIAEKYLNHSDLELQLSACWIYGYANLALDSTENTYKILEKVKDEVLNNYKELPFEKRALAVAISTSATVLLHLPLPEDLQILEEHLKALPIGLKLFLLYVQAHRFYLQKQYGICIGIAETALVMEKEIYPIPTIYLHLVAAMGYINLKHLEKAREHLLKAWEIAQPDDMIEAFSEHHGLLCGMLEAVIKKDFPKDFTRMINITQSFSSGWRKIHNQITGFTVTKDLTTTEFAVAMLAARNWSNKEISVHLGISPNTVKIHISSALQKLNISHRKELSKFMLQ